jgi:uncharacterized protein (TIGR02453 family)
MAKSAYFGPELFEFLTDLKNHNDREWFAENKARYEAVVRDPFLRLIGDLQPGFHDLNPKIVVDPSPNRGSMFRIYRDTRFSADKTPYKTHVAAHFKYARANPGAMPGYYLHLEPGECMLGAGVWHPEPRAVQRIRSAIVSKSAEWKKVRGGLELIGESLKRPPAGYGADHPLIEDLKRKDFAAIVPLKESEVLGTKLVSVLLARFREIRPLVEFLTSAVGLK